MLEKINMGNSEECKKIKIKIIFLIQIKCICYYNVYILIVK